MIEAIKSILTPTVATDGSSLKSAKAAADATLDAAIKAAQASHSTAVETVKAGAATELASIVSLIEVAKRRAAELDGLGEGLVNTKVLDDVLAGCDVVLS